MNRLDGPQAGAMVPASSVLSQEQIDHLIENPEAMKGTTEAIFKALQRREESAQQKELNAQVIDLGTTPLDSYISNILACIACSQKTHLLKTTNPKVVPTGAGLPYEDAEFLNGAIDKLNAEGFYNGNEKPIVKSRFIEIKANPMPSERRAGFLINEFTIQKGNKIAKLLCSLAVPKVPGQHIRKTMHPSCITFSNGKNAEEVMSILPVVNAYFVTADPQKTAKLRTAVNGSASFATPQGKAVGKETLALADSTDRKELFKRVCQYRPEPSYDAYSRQIAERVNGLINGHSETRPENFDFGIASLLFETASNSFLYYDKPCFKMKMMNAACHEKWFGMPQKTMEELKTFPQRLFDANRTPSYSGLSPEGGGLKKLLKVNPMGSHLGFEVTHPVSLEQLFPPVPAATSR